MGPAGIYDSKPIQSRVSVLEGDFAVISSIGLPVCLCVQLQVSCRCLKLDEALWTARSTPDGFSALHQNLLHLIMTVYQSLLR